MPKLQRIRRGFVTIGDRQVHYRSAGTGPPVILIHQSPTSARTLDLQTARYAEAFTAIAIDIPGLGRSDPLTIEWPSIGDQAEALREFVDALAIARTALYGSHTGASIVVEFARRYPERTTLAMVEGYPIYTPAERARRVAFYGASFEPRWDGGHLLWLWHRYREQYLFWPWNAPSRATRARCDVPDPDFLHAGIVDVLGVGNDYWKPYSAAFRFESEKPIQELRVPTAFLAYPDDSLFKALELLPRVPKCCWIERMPADRARGAEREFRLLRRFNRLDDAPALPATTRRAQGWTRRYIATAGTQLMIRERGSRGGRPLVAIAPAPGSAAMLEPLLSELARERHVIALDPPGCGDSDRHDGKIAKMARTVAAALRRDGLREVDLYARHGGASLALEIARGGRIKINRLVAEAVPSLGHLEARRLAASVPELAPRWDGTHLVTLWHHLRNRELFWPWDDQRLAAIRDVEPRIDAATLTVQALSCMKHLHSHAARWREILMHRPNAAGIAAPILFCARRDDPFAAGTRALARHHGARFTAMPEDVSDQARIVVGFLAGNVQRARA
jgi:pimeloyl-ACP methyl ester carboxylesterase